MKNIILMLFAVVSLTACSHNQKYSTTLPESPQSVAARTLGLPASYASYHDNIIIGSEANTIVLYKHVDRAKSLKVETGKDVKGNPKYRYDNAPDRFEFKFEPVTVDLNGKNQNFYLLNYLKGFNGYPMATATDEGVHVPARDFTSSNGEELWTGHISLKLKDNPIRIESSGMPGANNNTIPKIRDKYDASTKSYSYKLPVDYKGDPIIGVDAYNQGATATAIRVPKANRYVSVNMTTITTVGSGSFSTSNPVWSGGVKVNKTTSLTYIALSELLDSLRMTEDQLAEALKTTFKTSPRSPSTHILSTSCEIVQSIDTYTGITYYNGLDTRLYPPSGKTTSYNKPYPGHVVRWVFEAEGVTGARGGYQIAQFKSSEVNTIKVVPGGKYGYNAATKTFTYDRDGRLVFEYEEGSMLTAQGHTHADRVSVPLISPSSKKIAV